MRTTLFFLAFIFFTQCFGQTAQDTKPADWLWEDEQIFRKQLEMEGIPPAAVEKLVASRKQLILSGRSVSSIRNTGTQTDKKEPVPFALCSDMGVENGWGAWTARTGVFTGITPIPWSGPLPAPVAPRFNITTGSGIDACTPGPTLGYPTIPVVAPGFGSSSIQLGQPQTNGAAGGCSSGCAEQLTYALTVTAQDTDMTFSYAMVIEDPNHAPADQPFVSLCIMDQNGDTVPCGFFKYTAGPSIPGFFTSACNINSVSYYKPWTILGVKLANYVGQTLTIEIINADCSLSGHFAHSYWDFSCGAMQLDHCNGSLDTLCAPADSSNPYTYQWFHDGDTIPGATSACLFFIPQVYDTFSVFITPPSSCYFELVYLLRDTCKMYAANATSTPDHCSQGMGAASVNVQNGTPPYTYLWNTGATTQTITGLTPGTYTVTVTDALNQSDITTVVVGNMVVSGTTTATASSCLASNGTATANPSGGVPPYSYLWSNSQITQTATGLAAGTYSVTVTDSLGCTAVLTATVTNGTMTGTVFISSVSCFGGTNGSVALSTSGGNAPYTYQWSNGQTTAVTTGLSAGSYSVLVTDGGGCTLSFTATVTGAPMLVTNASNTPSSCWNCPDGSAGTNAIGGTPPYTFNWSPGGQTTPNIVGLVPGMYAVCVTDSKGCMKCDTLWVLYVGVNEILSSSVTLSPNPSSGILSIDFGTKNFGEATVSFCDVVGKTVGEFQIRAKGKHTLDVSMLSEGIYFLRIRTQSGIATKKIVISR